jgi:hypothetical protein
MITIATLPNHTDQEVFDYIANHLLSQGEKCQEIDDIYDGPLCKYRNSDNQSCAAGCLFGPGEYKPSYEGNNWVNLRDKGIVPETHFGLITALQRVHDTVLADMWYRALQLVAQDFNLDAHNLVQSGGENNYV